MDDAPFFKAYSECKTDEEIAKKVRQYFGGAEEGLNHLEELGYDISVHVSDGYSGTKLHVGISKTITQHIDL